MGSNIREIRHAAELRTLCSVSGECIPSEIKCFRVTAKVLGHLSLTRGENVLDSLWDGSIQLSTDLCRADVDCECEG